MHVICANLKVASLSTSNCIFESAIFAIIVGTKGIHFLCPYVEVCKAHARGQFIILKEYCPQGSRWWLLDLWVRGQCIAIVHEDEDRLAGPHENSLSSTAQPVILFEILRKVIYSVKNLKFRVRKHLWFHLDKLYWKRKEKNKIKSSRILIHCPLEHIVLSRVYEDKYMLR